MGALSLIQPEEVEQHTLGHTNCPACARVLTEAMYSGQFHTYLFPFAAQVWLSVKAKTISAAMTHDYKDCIKALNRFFAFLPLEKIHIGHVQVYQQSRKAKAGAARINKEIVTLGQIMASAGLWEPIKRHYKPLPVPDSIGMALTPEEEEYLFQLAAHSKWGRWLVCYCACLISNGTTAGPGEIRHLQIRDLDLQKGLVYVQRGLKNRFRKRPLPLNDDARWAVEQLLQRYHEMCKRYKILEAPDHYLLFHRSHKKGVAPDPTKPQFGWYRAWHSLRAELAKKYPHLAKLRRYDLRHNATTKMVEMGVPEPIVREMLGHKPNSQIVARYSHIRLKPKWEAARLLEGRFRPDPPTLDAVPSPTPVLVAELPAQSPERRLQVVNTSKVEMLFPRRPWHG